MFRTIQDYFAIQGFKSFVCPIASHNVTTWPQSGNWQKCRCGRSSSQVYNNLCVFILVLKYSSMHNWNLNTHKHLLRLWPGEKNTRVQILGCDGVREFMWSFQAVCEQNCEDPEDSWARLDSSNQNFSKTFIVCVWAISRRYFLHCYSCNMWPHL